MECRCAVGSAVDLYLQVDQVGRSLQAEDEHGEISGVLVEFLPTAFTLSLHFLERGENHAAELDYDRCRDVRHDAQGEDRRL